MPRITPEKLAAMRTIGYIGPRESAAREWRTSDGERHKATTDEAGNTVTEHARGDRRDVKINAPTVHAKARTTQPKG